LYNLGVLLLDEKRAPEAIPLFEKARQSGPPSAELAANSLRAYLEAKRNPAALSLLRGASQQFAQEPAFHAVAGRLLLEYNLPAPACDEFDAANRLAPAQTEIVLPMAKACLAANDPTRARSALASLTEPPDNAPVLLQLARLDQKLGEQQKALALLEQAERADPSLAEVPYSMAVSYVAAQDEAAAISLLERALKLNPHFDRAQFFLGTIHLSALRLAEADPLLTAALQADPRNPFYQCFVGLLRVNQLRYTEAKDAFAKAEALRPAYALPHFYMGRMCNETGNTKEAVSELERAIALNPELAEAYYQLGTLLKRLGQTERAEAALARFQSFRRAEKGERANVMRELRETLP
jgi:tetratricopeptide (TPR) repeat protein